MIWPFHRLSAPSFWHRNGALSGFLAPFSVFYFIWLRLREKRVTPQKLPVPIICIGNAVAGGAGKTPLCIAIRQWCDAPVAFISRGYGGSLGKETPVRIDPTRHSAAEAGDEPLLLARHAPCYVGDRVAAANMAVAEGAKLLILDDGLHDLRLDMDVRVLTVDGIYGFGNGLVMPAGPLRDAPKQVFSRAHFALFIGGDQTGLMAKYAPALPAFNAHAVLPDAPDAAPCLAFAGIGRPEKFFASLVRHGYALAATKNFADHYRYREADLEALEVAAKKANARLITTEKDWVRLPEAWQTRITAIPMTLRFEDEAALKRQLHERLSPYGLSL